MIFFTVLLINGKMTKYKVVPQLSMSILEKIVAVGGGRFKSSPRTTMNYATQAKKQIGSAAKPIFDYGPAIEYNNWSTYTQIEDAPYTYSDGTTINNSDRKYMGWISLRTALAESRNIPALKAFQSVDNKKNYRIC